MVGFHRRAFFCASVALCGLGERRDRVFPDRHLDDGFVAGPVVADLQVEGVVELAFEAFGKFGQVGLQPRDLIE
jgi:hypothetical protein